MLLEIVHAVSYLIGGRVPVTLTTPEVRVVTANAVIESVAMTPKGRRLVFWCESVPGPVASCFAQAFSPAGVPDSGIVPVFDLPPSTEERVVPRYGAALWTGEDDALLLIGCRRKIGSQLLVQHWKHGSASEPVLVTNAIELDAWATLVRMPDGGIYAVWIEKEEAFAICARRILPDGTPSGPPLKLLKVYELASPRAVAVSGTQSGLNVAWAEHHEHHPTVYLERFDKEGHCVGEAVKAFGDLAVTDPSMITTSDDQLVIAGATPDGDLLLRGPGGEIATVTTWIKPGSLHLAINGSTIAVAWPNDHDDLYLRSYSTKLEPLGAEVLIAKDVERQFISLDPRGASWLLHFRKPPPDAKLHNIWLTSASPP